MNKLCMNSICTNPADMYINGDPICKFCARSQLTRDMQVYLDLGATTEVVDTPKVWTHTPVPDGMDIVALNKHFEERAASVLGDWDDPVQFTVLDDGRYSDFSLRCAWMMYLDYSIEQHEASEAEHLRSPEHLACLDSLCKSSDA